MQFWNELEGQEIEGLYPLRRLVRSEGRSAWFETETGEPQSLPATISLTEALTDADEVVERLQAAQNLKNPNLVSITRVGQTSLDNTLFVYAVMEHIEQSLSDVLQSQALSAEEGRQVAEAMVGALTAIHQQGMSHGHVEAASILATGETVKLRSDCLQKTPASQAQDVAGIGATLFHAFTQRKAPSATDAQINRIPAPFAEIVRNSFARRWTLAQIANALKPAPPVVDAPPPPPVPLPPPPPPRPAPEPIAAPLPEQLLEKLPGKAPEKVPEKVPERVPKYRPVAPPIPVAPLPPAIEEDEPHVAKPSRPMWLYVALALAVLAVIGWLALRPKSAPAPDNTPPAPTQAVAPPSPEAPAPEAKPSPETKTLPSAKPSPAPAHESRSASPAAVSNGRSVWRVIAYTYKSQQLATDMVAQLAGKHPNLKVSVFDPPGRSGVYQVILGGDMDRDQATKMLDKAHSMGMPADTYIQNFSE
jgi:eukaryotic-like serine/threonine-protein kinase